MGGKKEGAFPSFFLPILEWRTCERCRTRCSDGASKSRAAHACYFGGASKSEMGTIDISAIEWLANGIELFGPRCFLWGLAKNRFQVGLHSIPFKSAGQFCSGSSFL